MKRTASAFRDRLKRTVSSTYLKIALAAVILIPLMYGALYLTAFWDPYANMSELPVAVVNEDSGYKTENVGNSLVSTLKKNDQAKWEFVSQKTAEKGLNSKKYYAEIIIPSDFSKDVYSVDTANPTKAELIYRSRVANNFLADTILGNVAKEVGQSLSHELSAKYIKNIFSSLRSTGDSLETAATASGTLATGLDSISAGSISLTSGVNTALDGSDQILSGLNTVKSGQDALTSGLNTAASKTKESANNFKTVAPILTKIVTDLNYYKITGDQTKLAEAVAYANALAQQGVSLTDSADNLTDLATQLQVAADSSAQLSAGTGKLITGTQTLNNGLKTISSGSISLTTNINTAAEGAATLSDSLSSGATTIQQATTSSKVLKETTVMSSPVKITTKNYDVVPNYGSGFAPYFISLSLWVGGIMAFFVVDFKKKTVGRRAAVAKYLTLALIGTTQALLLGAVLQDLLGLKIVNQAAYYGFIVLTSWSFMAFLQLLIQHLNDAGRYIAVILLILQLAACAGTFPIELIPKFFQIINPLMPMTYTVQGLRAILYTHALSQAIVPTLIMFGILIISLGLNLFITKRKKALYYKYEQKTEVA